MVAGVSSTTTRDSQNQKAVRHIANKTELRVSFLLTALTLAALLAGLALDRIFQNEAWSWVAFGTAYLAGGIPALTTALRQLMQGEFNIDLLMVVAAIGAAVTREPVDGAILLFLFSLANALEAFALRRTTQAIQALEELRPEGANRLIGDKEEWVPLDELKRGDRIRVRPGERFAADGIVVEGASAVDQSVLTGESLPVDKVQGDTVFASTLNSYGVLVMEVTKPASDSTLSRLIALVEQARAEKSNAEEFTSWFGRRYTVLVLAGSLTAFLIHLALGRPFNAALYQTMVLLVAASPCAVVISAPASLLPAMARGARMGVLFKSGAAMEVLGQVKAMAFDKTGTLTQGRPQVVDMVALHSKPAEVLAQAAALEALSEHPIAQAVVEGAKERSIALPEVTEVRTIVSEGIVGVIGGQPVWAGNDRLARRMDVTPDAEAQAALDVFAHKGYTSVLLGSRRVFGVMAIADKLRPEAGPALKALKKLGIHPLIMLTGDNAKVAQTVAQQAGADQHYASLLPDDKLRLVQELHNQHGTVAMVGDGVNDAPVLSGADVGIAMGSAHNDVALESADVVLMSSNLTVLTDAIALARQARRVVIQNLTIGLVTIAILVILTLLGYLKLPPAVFGHEGSTVVVAMNGLRLLAWKPRPGPR